MLVAFNSWTICKIIKTLGICITKTQCTVGPLSDKINIRCLFLFLLWQHKIPAVKRGSACGGGLSRCRKIPPCTHCHPSPPISSLPAFFLTTHLFLHSSLPSSLSIPFFCLNNSLIPQELGKDCLIEKLVACYQQTLFEQTFSHLYPFANISSFFLSCLLHATAVQLEAVLCWILTIRVRIAVSPSRASFTVILSWGTN